MFHIFPFSIHFLFGNGKEIADTIYAGVHVDNNVLTQNAVHITYKQEEGCYINYLKLFSIYPSQTLASSKASNIVNIQTKL